MRIVCWQTILMKYHTLFISKLGMMSQNLLSAAVVNGALRVNPYKPSVLFVEHVQTVLTQIRIPLMLIEE